MLNEAQLLRAAQEWRIATDEAERRGILPQQFLVDCGLAHTTILSWLEGHRGILDDEGKQGSNGRAY